MVGWPTKLINLIACIVSVQAIEKTRFESNKRIIAKTVSYRGVVMAILAAVSWIFTADAGQTTIITIVYAALATIAYYGHEKIWARINWSLR